ncbi:MAG: hypothetical protein V1798_02515 [Pseudomonadota bacterium]
MSGISILGAGCQKQMDVSISPEEGKQNVPVNAVVRVKYVGDYSIKKNETRNKEKFRLVTCSGVQESSTNSTPNSQPKSDTSNNSNSGQPNNGGKPADSQTDQTKQSNTNTSAPTGTPVKGRLIRRDFNVIRTYKDGTKKSLKRTDVVFMPELNPNGEAPLESDTDYCFTADAVYDEGGNLIPATDTSFHTEVSGNFAFPDDPVAVTVLFPTTKNTPRTINSNDSIIVRFDSPVRPSEFDPDGAMVLCQHTIAATGTSTTSTTTTPDPDCVNLDGGTRLKSPTVVTEQIEAFPEAGDIVTAQYDTYEIKVPSGFATDDGKGNPVAYTLKVDLAKNGNLVTGVDRRFQFKATESTETTSSAAIWGFLGNFDRADATIIPLQEDDQTR